MSVIALGFSPCGILFRNQATSKCCRVLTNPKIIRPSEGGNSCTSPAFWCSLTEGAPPHSGGRMHRRQFLVRSATGLGAAWLSSKTILAALANTTLGTKFSASDTVTLGSTGIKTSRLAMGTGTVGTGHHSHQTALGVKGLSDLLLNGYDHGLRFFDAADSYGSHPHVPEALKNWPRDKVTGLAKTWSRDAKDARADLDRFRKELATDYLDICLIHCVTEGDWTDRYRGVMDVLAEAKEKGTIRAHGCSCHSIEALRAAAQSPWGGV